jgi:hypothetical protein
VSSHHPLVALGAVEDDGQLELLRLAKREDHRAKDSEMTIRSEHRGWKRKRKRGNGYLRGALADNLTLFGNLAEVNLLKSVKI